jgi:hypothetical protein
VKDDLNGLDKAVSAVLGERTIERNLLLVKVAKSKLAKHQDDKNEKVTKPEELVRLYDLLLQVDIYVFVCEHVLIEYTFLVKDPPGCWISLFSYYFFYFMLLKWNDTTSSVMYLAEHS